MMWQRIEQAGFPDCLELLVPRGAAEQQCSLGELLDFVACGREGLDSRLSRSGGMLIRGFAALEPRNSGPVAFRKFAKAFFSSLSEYVGGGSPRTSLGEGLYTSTEYPNQLHIPLHLEGSYLPLMPTRICFYCDVPPKTRGRTPVGDMAAVYRELPGDVVRRFTEQGVCYIQNLRGAKGFGKGWKETFLTDDRAKVEALLVRDGYEFAWSGDGGLHTRIVRPGVGIDPGSGLPVWLNQAINWHPSEFTLETRNRLRDLYGSEFRFPKYAAFGNGDPIDDQVMAQVRRALGAQERYFTWQAGDVLLLNNQRMAHGREPFDGDRRILVAMG